MNEEAKLIVDNTFNLDEDKENNSPFGKRWGGQVFAISQQELEHLKEGKLLALDVMAEYIVYVKLDSKS